MRKFFIMVGFIICFVLVGFCQYDSINFDFTETCNPKYYFYVALNNNIEDEHYIKNGLGGVIILNHNELNLLNNFSINKMYGKSIEIDSKKISFDNVIKLSNINIVKREEFNDLKCVYGYNKKFSDYVVIDGEKINCQIALRNNVISIGYPILLGSY